MVSSEPTYIVSSFHTITVRAFIVNSFGKTVRPRRSYFAATIVNDTDRNNINVWSYIQQSGDLTVNFPSSLDIRTVFRSAENRDIFVEISLTSAANFTAAISTLPVYAGTFLEFMLV